MPTEQPIDRDPASKKKPYEAYARYSGLAVQMGVMIFLGVWGGQRLDQRWETEPWLSVTGSLFGVGASLYLVIKELLADR